MTQRQAGWLLAILLVLMLIGLTTIGYVVWHFVAKFW